MSVRVELLRSMRTTLLRQTEEAIKKSKAAAAPASSSHRRPSTKAAHRRRSDKTSHTPHGSSPQSFFDQDAFLCMQKVFEAKNSTQVNSGEMLGEVHLAAVIRALSPAAAAAAAVDLSRCLDLQGELSSANNIKDYLDGMQETLQRPHCFDDDDGRNDSAAAILAAHLEELHAKGVFPLPRHVVSDLFSPFNHHTGLIDGGSNGAEEEEEDHDQRMNRLFAPPPQHTNTTATHFQDSRGGAPEEERNLFEWPEDIFVGETISSLHAHPPREGDHNYAGDTTRVLEIHQDRSVNGAEEEASLLSKRPLLPSSFHLGREHPTPTTTTTLLNPEGDVQAQVHPMCDDFMDVVEIEEEQDREDTATRNVENCPNAPTPAITTTTATAAAAAVPLQLPSFRRSLGTLHDCYQRRGTEAVLVGSSGGGGSLSREQQQDLDEIQDSDDDNEEEEEEERMRDTVEDAQRTTQQLAPPPSLKRKIQICPRGRRTTNESALGGGGGIGSRMQPLSLSNAPFSPGGDPGTTTNTTTTATASPAAATAIVSSHQATTGVTAFASAAPPVSAQQLPSFTKRTPITSTTVPSANLMQISTVVSILPGPHLALSWEGPTRDPAALRPSTLLKYVVFLSFSRGNLYYCIFIF